MSEFRNPEDNVWLSRYQEIERSVANQLNETGALLMDIHGVESALELEDEELLPVICDTLTKEVAFFLQQSTGLTDEALENKIIQGFVSARVQLDLASSEEPSNLRKGTKFIVRRIRDMLTSANPTKAEREAVAILIQVGRSIDVLLSKRK